MSRGVDVRAGFRAAWAVMVLSGLLLAASATTADGAAGVAVEIDRLPPTTAEEQGILDLDRDRILFREGTARDTYPPAGVLKVKDRPTGAITTIPEIPGHAPEYGFLTSHGAIFVADKETAPFAHVWEWSDGALIDHGGANSGISLVVDGDYAIWNNNPYLYRRELSRGKTITVADSAGNNRNDVAANGYVAYWAYPEYSIHLYRNGPTDELANDYPTLWNVYPVTDGTSVVYLKQTPCCFDQTYQITAHTPAGEVVLAPARSRGPNPTPAPPGDYQIADGWIAYTRIGSANQRIVWLRDPSGNETQISPTSANATIRALAPGEVMFHADGHLYLGRPGAAPIDFGTEPASYYAHRLFWLDGTWYLAIEGTLYRLDVITGYARPKSASPALFSLVVAYEQCTDPNLTHGPPLAHPSCGAPQKASDHLTVGTPDANGLPPWNDGFLKLKTLVGNPATPADEADIQLDFYLDDVYTNALADYTGELRAEYTVRITDRDSPGPPGEPPAATVTDVPLGMTASCTPITDLPRGATCAATTTMDALVPGSVKEGKRTIWALDRVRVFDGGADGDGDTAGDNTLFATQGVFIP